MGQQDILQFLKRNRRFHTARDLSNGLGISLTSVHVNISKLKRRGFVQAKDKMLKVGKRKYKAPTQVYRVK